MDFSSNASLPRGRNHFQSKILHCICSLQYSWTFPGASASGLLFFPVAANLFWAYHVVAEMGPPPQEPRLVFRLLCFYFVVVIVVVVLCIVFSFSMISNFLVGSFLIPGVLLPLLFAKLLFSRCLDSSSKRGYDMLPAFTLSSSYWKSVQF